MIVKVIRVGDTVVDYHVEGEVTVGAFLDGRGISAEGRSIVLNGSPAVRETVITTDSTLLLAPSVKGGR